MSGLGWKDLRGGAGAGLVEIEVDDTTKQVVLSLHPPKRNPVTLPMGPQAAQDLANGLLDAVDAIRNPPPPMIHGLPEA